jgi:gamma-glutamylputrescine oxidase
MNFSYWENKEFIGKPDVVVIGSGITGLSAAIHLKRGNPKLNVLMLERGMTPWGASSKNAGFACFGSLGELLDDLQNTTIDEIVGLIRYRKKGLEALIGLLGKEYVDYQQNGGFELFKPDQIEEFENCRERMEEFNSLLKNDFGGEVFELHENTFGFDSILGLIKNNFEAQIDTGKMMQAYLTLAKNEGVQLLNGASVENIDDSSGNVSLLLKGGMTIKTGHVVICSNGFAKQFIDDDIEPARAQVIITKPIENLQIKGTFHYDKGYYYFRNIDNRILLGGGRNLDLEGENTNEMNCSMPILNKLNELMREVILPNTPFEIDYSWAGIMGVGAAKTPIIKNLSNNVSCGVRLGGMGVALGTSVGKDCADLYFKGL